MSICSTASATARRKSASPLFASSSASGSLSSVIGSVLIGQGWEPRNSTLAVRSDGPLSATSRPASEFHHLRGRYRHRGVGHAVPCSFEESAEYRSEERRVG